MAVIIVTVDDAGNVTRIRRDESVKADDAGTVPAGVKITRSLTGSPVTFRPGTLLGPRDKLVAQINSSKALTAEQKATYVGVLNSIQEGDAFGIENPGLALQLKQAVDGAAAPPTRKPITRFVDP